MTRFLKEEKFSDEDWDDVFHVCLSTIVWLSNNIKTDSQLLSEGKIPPSSRESSHVKKKQQKD
jgi:hypothetical protein